MEIYVDADACPVRGEVLRVAERHGLPVVFVSNQGIRPDPNPRVRQVVVSDGADAADDWIAERIAPGDIAVTTDIPLADRCLKAGARVLSPTGKAFTQANIGRALASREVNRHLREIGAGGNANAAFGPNDRSNFLQALENAVQAAKRGR